MHAQVGAEARAALQRPEVSAGADVTGWANELLTLNGAVTGEDLGSLTLSWSFVPNEGTDPTATCTFGSPGAAITTVSCTHEGSYTVKLTALDGVNPPPSATATVTLRNASKVTMCNLPRYTKQTPLRLCGYITPGLDGSGIASAWFTVNGGAPIPVVPNSSGFVDTSTPLAEGTYTVRLSAQSKAGHLTLQQKTVTVDLTAPTLTVLSPTSSDALESTVVAVTSSVVDVSRVTVKTQFVQTSVVESGVGTVTHTIDLKNRGFSTLLVSATDAVGNVTEVRVRVYVRTLSCGDGVKSGTELCDDGNAVTESACPYGQASCTACDVTCSRVLSLTGSYCGDGVKDSAEACDDGNTVTEDACPSGQLRCTFCDSSCSAVLDLVFLCTNDSQCDSGNYCDSSGACVPKQPNGEACGAANQCVSGNCVNGVCRDTLCGGACDACHSEVLASATHAPSDGLAFVTLTVTPRDAKGEPLGTGLHVEVRSNNGLVTLGGTGTSACTVNAPSATCLTAVDSGAGSYVVTARSSTPQSVPTTFSATVTDANGTVTLPDTADVTFDSALFQGGAGCGGACGTTITTGNVTLTANHAGGRNLYITGGTVTFDATTVGQTFGDVFITGGTVTHPQATNAAMFKLDILTGSWNLLGGTVNTTSKGYGMTCFANGSCSGNGRVSFGPNGAPSSSLAGTSELYGASHGGMGSGNYRINMTGASNSHAGNAGPTYGDYRDPMFPGATNSTYSGFHGGGVARIISAGTCVLAGTASITATSPFNGAGGSINLRCRGITSTGWTGSISADGGPGAGNSSIPMGAGGGGRIALVSTGDAATLTGTVSYPPTNLTARVHAFGGAPANSSYVVGAGGAGTIYLKHCGLTYGDLIIANNSPAHYQNEGTTRLPALAGTVTGSVAAGATSLPVSVASTSLNATYYENAGAPLNTNPALTQNMTPSASASYNGVFAGGWLRPDITAAGGALFDPSNLVGVTTNEVGLLTTTAAPSEIAAGAFFRSVDVLDHLDVLGNAMLETNGDIYVLSGNTTNSGASTMTVNGLVLFDTTSGRTGRIEYAGGAVNVVQGTQVMPPVAGATLVADNVSVSGGALTVPAIVAAHDVVVTGGTLTTNALTAARYTQTAGLLKHYPPLFKTSPAAAQVYGLHMTLGETFSLRGGSVDVAGLGYPMASDPQGTPLTAWGFGATGPSSATGVAGGYGAGHGGVGGGYVAGSVRGMAYGDYRDPRYPGGAGTTVGGSPSYLGFRSPGGGVFRLTAAGICTLGGSSLIKAGAVTTGHQYGAAGGSVSLRCGGFDTTGWNGTITANGGNAYTSSSVGSTRAGGGGRIALVSTGGASSFIGALSYPLPTGTAQLQARGGTGVNATYTDGGAGTVFLKHGGVRYGQLLINNNNQTHYAAGGYTPFISIAGTVNSAVSAGDTSISVNITSTPLHNTAAFNQRLAGMWLRPDTSVNSGSLPADNLVTVLGNTYVSASQTQLTTSPALVAVPAGASFKSADIFDVYNVVGGAIPQTNGDLYIVP